MEGADRLREDFVSNVPIADEHRTERFKDWVTIPSPWWTFVFILPVLRLLVKPLKKADWLEPNHVTIFSFVLSLVALALIFLDMGWAYLVVGILVFVSYFFDCMDGMIARMNHKKSGFGAFLDFTLDRWKTMLMSWALFWVSMTYHGDVITSLLIMVYVCLFLLNTATSFGIKEIIGGPRWSESEFETEIKQDGLLGKWMDFCDRVGIRPTASDVEADMCVFFVGMILLWLYGWQALIPCLIIAILIYLVPLQMGHIYFAYRYLGRTTAGKGD